MEPLGIITATTTAKNQTDTAVPFTIKPGTRILIVSGFESPALAQQALRSCASDFVEKGAGLRELADTAHRIASGPPKLCA